MKDRSFGRLVAELSKEAERDKVEEAQLKADHAQRDKIKGNIIFGVIAGLYAIIYFNHAEINDTVAKLFSSKEPEYTSIRNLSAEIDAEKSGADDTTTDPSSRKGKLKDVLKKAKQHAQVVDDIMDDAPAAPKKK